eukprot:3727996-Pyramimonas_sp.AAC.1
METELAAVLAVWMSTMRRTTKSSAARPARSWASPALGTHLVIARAASECKQSPSKPRGSPRIS